jgi:hypothetical protein
MTQQTQHDIDGLMGGISLKDAIEAGLVDPDFEKSHNDNRLEVKTEEMDNDS